MQEEKLKDAIVAELKRQAANHPDAIQVQSEEELVVMVVLDTLMMVIRLSGGQSLNTSPFGVAQPTVKHSPTISKGGNYGP